MQYEIKGTPFPAVICHLQDGEQMITEGGGMSWMTPNITVMAAYSRPYIWSLYVSAVIIPSLTCNLQILAFRLSPASPSSSISLA